MKSTAPSPSQIEIFDHYRKPRPVVLFYQYDEAGETCRQALAQLAAQHGGRLTWAARAEQAFVGAVGQRQHACMLRFESRSGARDFLMSAEHAQALDGASDVEVAALNDQPRSLAIFSSLLARILPRLPFDNTVEAGEEPGVGSSGAMPTAAAIAELTAHPQQDTPVVMINWLKFRDTAHYPAGAAPVSGRTAYLRYGKVAMAATHSLGAKLLFGARYQQILIGNGGDPAPKLWDEFALMQYPGRATFKFMASLRRYRKSLHHREAGLTERGQGLTISRPCEEFVWRP